MSAAAVQRWLDQHVTYKPGWTIRVTDDAREGAWGEAKLQLSYEAEDTYNPGHTTRVVGQTIIDLAAFPTREQFLCFIRSQIHRLECHEADEWLKVDGQMPFDPHAHERAA